MELETGRLLGLKQDERFPMQSVFKLPIAIEELRQVDAGRVDLDREILLGRTTLARCHDDRASFADVSRSRRDGLCLLS
jgi:hypothetical protein